MEEKRREEKRREEKRREDESGKFEGTYRDTVVYEGYKHLASSNPNYIIDTVVSKLNENTTKIKGRSDGGWDFDFHVSKWEKTTNDEKTTVKAIDISDERRVNGELTKLYSDFSISYFYYGMDIDIATLKVAFVCKKGTEDEKTHSFIGIKQPL